MYFAAYPNSELVTPYAYLYYLNGSFNGPYQYASEANVTQNSAIYAWNGTSVPETPAMRQEIKNAQDNRYLNVQGGNLQQAPWTNPGQNETTQGLDKYFDASSYIRINSRIASYRATSDSVLNQKFYESSSQAGINFTNASDCHTTADSVLDQKLYESSHRAGINFANTDCHGETVSVADNYSKSSSQSAINSTNMDCHGRSVSVFDKNSGTISRAGINSRIADCQVGRLNNAKGFEIWRPFCPSPAKEVSADGSDRNQQNFPPPRTKIEHSKTSLFKPVKKRDYKCRYCASSFASSAQLNSHLKVHTGSKPFDCPSCPQRFARNEELTRHSRIHSGYKPHACRTCGKSFGRKDHLAKHAKTHLRTEEKKAYACTLPGCGNRYTRSDALTRHKTLAHATYRRKEELTVGLKKDIFIS
ncbi:hypothetical protein JTE90_008517 [Oedothorax gibbosus]|uniref:C2H2-type domain-containing protein n=1 Tax=Oedothorax gibbosus TaxID=931172 RepID=A0AAV6VIB3_9ARAC|nr:hypothetical protein JTE90_008517 [Oedothorax gibbosus]